MKYISLLKVKTLYLFYILPFIGLFFINIFIFAEHYLGQAIFPWDFLGGYHAMAYAWYSDGSFFSPPYWSPYTHFGYPTHLALQNSSFYLPLAILDWFGVPYTHPVATQLQCFHVFLGGVGTYLFLKSRNLSVWTAFNGAIAYQLSSGFFSNAQHVDIIRGYTWLPWLFWSLSFTFLSQKGYSRILISALILFIFLTGSYPGVIVASVYAMFYLTLGEFFGRKVEKCKLYFFKLFTSITLGLLLSSVKFLPLLALIGEIQPSTEVSGVYKIKLIHLLTIIFRSDLNFISGDITVRSLFISPVIIILIFYCKRLNRNFLLGLGLSFFALCLAFDWSGSSSTDISLPGIRLSRFPLLDYRCVIHIGFILAGCSVLEQISQPSFQIKSRKSQLGRLFLILLGCLAMISIALKAGYPFFQILPQILFMIIVIFIPFVSTRLQIQEYKLSKFLQITFCLVSIISSLVYLEYIKNTWYVSDYQPYLTNIYGTSLQSLSAQTPQDKILKPSRSNREFKSFALSDTRYDINYFNKAFYEKSFSTKGYDNGLKLRRRLKLLGAVGNDMLLQFLTDKSRVIIFPHIHEISSSNIDNCLSNLPLCDGHLIGKVQLQSYGLNSSRYLVYLNTDATLVENEMYYPGWSAELCDQQTCISLKARPISEISLRGWNLKSGQYILKTSYLPPFINIAWLLFIIACIIGFSMLFMDILTLIQHFYIS